MNRFALGFLIALLVPAGAMAKSWAIADDSPIATVTVPNDWSAEETDNGMEFTSKDEAIYLSVEAYDLGDLKDAKASALAFFKDRGAKVDPKSEHVTNFQLAGAAAVETDWQAIDDDGATHVSLTTVALAPKQSLVLTYWASEASEKANAETLKGIIASIKATK